MYPEITIKISPPPDGGAVTDQTAGLVQLDTGPAPSALDVQTGDTGGDAGQAPGPEEAGFTATGDTAVDDMPPPGPEADAASAMNGALEVAPGPEEATTAPPSGDESAGEAPGLDDAGMDAWQAAGEVAPAPSDDDGEAPEGEAPDTGTPGPDE